MIRTGRRRLALIVLGALFGVLPAWLAATAPALAQLTIGVHHDNRPWEFREPSGVYVGFDIDMVRALGAELGVEVTTRPLGFAELFDALDAGQVDAVASSLTITPARLARFDFTQPYYRTSQAVAVLKNAGIRDLEGLAGKTVATTPSSTNAQWLEASRGRYAIRSIRYVDSMDEALALLRRGEVTAYFGDEPALLYALLESRDLAVIARLPTEDRYGIMLRPGSPWTARLDSALSAIKVNGTLAAIHRKWFGSRPPPDSPVTTVLPRP